MAETYGFYDSKDDDERIYTADDFNNVLAQLVTDGVAGGDNSLKSGRDGFNLTVSAGCAIISGHWYINDSSKTLRASAPSSGVRYDRVVLRMFLNQNKIALVLRQGTSTAPPELNNNSSFREIPVSLLLVSTSGIQSVTDERKFITLRGGV